MFQRIVQQIGWPKFRSKQINHAIFRQLIHDWEQATSLPKEVRNYLKLNVKLSDLELVSERISDKSDTIKVLFKLEDGNLIESVLMMHEGRNTVCVSSQSGCPVGCKFCATGAMGFKRNLTAKEIVDQVLYFARKLEKTTPVRKSDHPSLERRGNTFSTGNTINNIVFMGMGEPMLNLNNVSRAVEILTDDHMFGLGKRKITVSTSGYIEPLKKFLEQFPHIGLAISLHAPNQELREKLMPNVAKANTIKELLKVCREYSKQTSRRVSYEYILIEGLNDSLKQAKKLAEILYDHQFFVNLIPYNPPTKTTTPIRPDGLCCPSSCEEGNCLELSTTEKENGCVCFSSLPRRSGKPQRGAPEVVGAINKLNMKKPNNFRVNRFKDELNKLGVPVAVRVAMGADIGGACGQLSSKK